MKPSDNNLRQLLLGCLAPVAIILGTIAAYIGFTFDFNGILAAGALASTFGICYFMNPKN